MRHTPDPDDPRRYPERTWWMWFKGWPLRVVITVACLIAVSAIVNLIDAEYRIF